MNRLCTTLLSSVFLSCLAIAAFPQGGSPLSDAMSRSAPGDTTIYYRLPIPEDISVNWRTLLRSNFNEFGGLQSDSTLLTVVGDGYLVGVGGEPSIAVNPLNPNQIIISSFATFSFTGPAPLYYSQDGGNTFTQYNSISHPPGGGGIPDDQTFDYGQDGTLYGALLAFNQTQQGANIYTGSTNAPDSASAWRWPLKGNGDAQNIDINGTPFVSDQPWLITNPDPLLGLGTDRVYTAYDDFGVGRNRVSISHPGVPPLLFSSDNAVGVFTFGINPGLRMAGDPSSGAVYVIHQFRHGQNMDGSFDVGYVLNRSTDGGATWGLNGNPNGIEIARHNTNQLNFPKFGTVNALIGGVDHLSVDPSTHDVYCVIGNRDSAGNNRLGLIRLHDNGFGSLLADPEHAIGVTGAGSVQSALPSIAVASNGDIGVLYDTFDGFSQTGSFPIFTAHLAQSYDKGVTWTDHVLLTFLSASKDNGNGRQRVLGDYQQMKTVGRYFYGAFTGNGAALGQNAVMGPIFFKSLANRAPVANPGADQTVECQGATTSVKLDGSQSSDPDGDPLTFQWSEGAAVLGNTAKLTVALSYGVHILTLKVTDPFGASDSKNVTITIVDTTPPVVTASANPTQLWPPNNKMVPVTISGKVSDLCTGVNLSSGAFTVQDSEGTVQPSGTFTINANGSYSFIVLLQASRDGKNKDGRTYSIQVTAKDIAGNVGQAVVTVIVPHDQGK